MTMRTSCLWLLPFVGSIFCSPSTAAGNSVLSGSQIRAQGGVEGRLIGDPITLPQGGVIVSVQCDGDGFWIQGQGGSRTFRRTNPAVNYVLPKGSFKAFPNLKPGQDRASVSIEIRPLAVPAAAPQSTTGSSPSVSPFDGSWAHTRRQHTDCGFSGESDIKITTDAQGVTWATSESFPGTAKGSVNGRIYSFQYGFVNGVPSGSGTLTLSADGRSFTGTFKDTDGHTGTITGSRNSTAAVAQSQSPFDGAWPRTKRVHIDCGYSAESDMQISTDAQGVTWATSADSGFPGKGQGKVVGNSFTFDYGIVQGVPSAKASLTLSADGRSFTGTFRDRDGHFGTLTGKR